MINYLNERIDLECLYEGPLGYTPIRPGSIVIYYNNKIAARDDGNGHFKKISGLVNYNTGYHTLSLPKHERFRNLITVSYSYMSESN